MIFHNISKLNLEKVILTNPNSNKYKYNNKVIINKQINNKINNSNNNTMMDNLNYK